MPVRIQRTLSGTYHVMIDDGEFILRKNDIRVIADQAVADGVIESRNHSHNDRLPRKFFSRCRTHRFGKRVRGDYYRAVLYIETAVALGIAHLGELSDFPDHVTVGWRALLIQAVAFMWWFHMAHWSFEASLRQDEEKAF